MTPSNPLIAEIRQHALPFSDLPKDFAPLIEMIGDARFVLIGEATHGTEEFYRIRAELSKVLIRDHGFAAVAIEGDWPDTFRANEYVRGDRHIIDAESALSGFKRFPSWMWRNGVTARFLDWLRDENAKRPAPQRAGFYGLDLYSLNASIEAVITYLDRVDPPAADRARQHYGCFDHHNVDRQQDYGLRAITGAAPSCEDDVVRELAALQKRMADYSKHNSGTGPEAFFSAEQNARAVIGAEHYYRSMFSNRVSSWNIRDRHMISTLDAIAGHLSDARNERAKLIVWAHNSHIGDARATEMGTAGEVTLGQLVREQHGEHDTRLIGFSTAKGTVTAASHWDGEPETKTILSPSRETYEGLFHACGLDSFALLLRSNFALAPHLSLTRLQRAIGVLYLPETERRSHYFFASLPQQFDALIHIDHTSALKPLDEIMLRSPVGEMAESYPTGL
jgi:erythromycin esterase-like protein